MSAPDLHQAAKTVIDLIPLPEGVHVVDVGCGARPGVMVTGVDPVEQQLDLARAEALARDLEITFVRGGAAVMPLPDGCADVVLSIFGLVSAPDPVAVAAELARITAPRGCLVMAMGLQVEGCFPWHDRDTVAELLKPHGFEVSAEPRARYVVIIARR